MVTVGESELSRRVLIDVRGVQLFRGGIPTRSAAAAESSEHRARAWYPQQDSKNNKCVLGLATQESAKH